jgi:hypothetical protein
MTFQFLCPQGHLLQGEESHMGMQCQCPECGMVFIIPTVERGASSSPEELSTAPSDLSPAELAPDGPTDAIGGLADEPAPREGQGVQQMDFDAADVGELNEAAAESMLHIPCPNGHELETPLSMIGERVMCPHCRVEFRLRREKSIEFLHQQELLDRRRAQFWFQAAVAAAAIVGLALVIMFAMMILS